MFASLHDALPAGRSFTVALKGWSAVVVVSVCIALVVVFVTTLIVVVVVVVVVVDVVLTAIVFIAIEVVATAIIVVDTVNSAITGDDWNIEDITDGVGTCVAAKVRTYML